MLSPDEKSGRSLSSDIIVPGDNDMNKTERQRHGQPRDSLVRPLTSQAALIKLHDDIDFEISTMKAEFAKRSFMSWLMESISFKSELSKMRWPGVLFMTTQAIAHFIVSFILKVENMATNWVGFQGFILTILLAFNLAVNLWDTKVRFMELLMKAEQIRDLVKRCSQDRHLLQRWRYYNWKSANPSTLFAPKSTCAHRTLTYRDESCLNLSDFLLVRGDIIHLYPGDRAPGECVSLANAGTVLNQTGAAESHEVTNEADNGRQERILLKEDEIFHPPRRGASKKFSANEQQDPSNDSGTTATRDSAPDCSFGSHARLKRALRGTDFMLLSTPYIKSLKISLQCSYKRPVNSIEKECFIVSRKYFETYVIPLVFVLSTIVTAIHYGYLDLTDSDQEIKTISIAYLLLRPSLTIMPFLPWMFPCFWMAVNAYGSARLLCCAETQRLRAAKSSEQQASDWFGDQQSPAEWQGLDGRKVSQFRSPGAASTFEGNLLATPTAAGSSDQNRHEDELQDLQNNVKFSKMFQVFVDLILARSGHVWRSSSLLQVLGCLTSLCCIDKVGILSWSNPTPEKVFVVTKNHQVQSNHDHNLIRQHLIMSSRRSSRQSEDLLSAHNLPITPNNAHESLNLRAADDTSSSSRQQQQELVMLSSSSPINFDREDQMSTSNQVGGLSSTTRQQQQHQHNHHHLFGAQHSRAEVLDVSQTFNTCRGPFSEPMSLKQQASRLQFDDPNWTRFLANLKPLGLAILMNNCSEQSFGDYFRFYKHISYESIMRCNLTPVVKRRCVCALAKLVGFSRDVLKSYKFVGQVGAYRLVDPSTTIMRKAGGSKLVSSLENATRLKLPFPNIVCNIQRDTATGGYQVFSHGTADLILDSCVEFWNGKQLAPLDDATRKKIMDFYHRTSLTSYCAAFSYTPLLSDHNLRGHYIEMPPDGGSKFSARYRRLTQEHDESFLQAQVMNLTPASALVPPPLPLERDNKISSRGYLASDEDNLIASSPNDAPITSSHSDLNVHDGERLPFHQVRRCHLSAENLLGGSQRESSLIARQESSSGLLATGTTGGSVDKRKKKGASQARRKLLDDALDELSDQVFVGMVSMQYQACPDFVTLVEQLEHACIRFVHFSTENELRSRVFSEKMGLESGWNCHVSLQSDEDLDEADKSVAGLSQKPPNHTSKQSYDGTHMESFSPPTRLASILVGTVAQEHHTRQLQQQAGQDAIDIKRDSLSSSNEGTLYSWRSLPSLVMEIISKVSGNEDKRHCHRKNGKNGLTNSSPTDSGAHDDECQGGDSNARGDGNGDEIIEMTAEGTESSMKDDEGFDTLAFDMSNRAKLPKGIENIRPHLETVDNIPLQVSLFTDCTPSLTKEMIEIMQDYGEIVCVIGSSASRLNTSVFLQANASIAIEPLMPESCIESRQDSSVRRGKRTQPHAGATRQAKSTVSAPEKHQQAGNLKRAAASPKSRRSSTRVGSKQRNKLGGLHAPVTELPVAATAAAAQVRINNPRDRLGIGPSIFNEQGDQFRNIKRNLKVATSSSSSSSSSTTSSSSSSSDSEQTNLSQSLSDSEPEDCPSSSSEKSSSCSSFTPRHHVRRRRRRHESRDRNNDETLEEARLVKSSDDDELADSSSGPQLSGSLVHELPEPSALASKLASLPCSYNYNRKEQVHLYGLIMEARHFTFKMKNTFVCMICFALSISSAQFLASILFLPPMLSSGLTIWLTVVVVPLMSFSLMATTMDTQVMKMAVGKNLQLKPENITFFVICYLIKFIPSIIVVVLNFGLIIAHSCKLTGFGSSSLGPCWMFTYVRHGNSSTSGSHGSGGTDDDGTAEEDLLWSSHLLTAQVSAAFLMVLYFVVISSGFVHRSHLMWQRNPARNRLWLLISLTLIIGQVFYNQLVLRVNLNSSNIPYEFLASLPLHIWVISFSWPVIVIGINLLVKRAEIKATIRQQRRARFDFNTKLGMNSPF